MRKEFVCVVTRYLLALGFFCAVSAQAADAQTTINVPTDQPTIQAGINAAVNGDTVMVAPGTYFENLNFSGKAITVTSSSGPSSTIVDGGGLGPVAIFDTNEGANSVLNGLTLQNGVPSQAFGGFGTSGGGILVVLSSPTVTNNVITGNHAICGIGIEVRNGSPLIRGNTITNNTQAGGTGGCGGGGIEVTGDSSHPAAAPLITGNTITNNSLNGGGFGGGISANFFASPTIQNNYISGNSVWNSGGGIDLRGSLTPVAVQNIIVNNSTLGGGSGAGINVQSVAVVVNNTIAGNTAFDASSGIFAGNASTAKISNNIVVAASGQNGIVCSSSTFPIFSHNDVTLTGTGGQAWSSTCASVASINGNISVDPQFVNAASNDFHLLAGSPVIDAGDNTAPDLPQQDYDGNARVAIGNATNGTATVDMGVYEFVLTGTPAAVLSPTSLSFADQAVNTSSAARTVTLSNTGADPLNISGISISGDFTQSNTCPATLTTGSSCAIQVTFQPTALGTRTGTLTVSSSSVPAAPAVALSGNGVQPGTPVTINVPDNEPTIQAAIDAAASGDTVMVAPGTYFENLNFNGKAITVTSSGGPSVTTVDGESLGPVVIFDTNEGPNSVLNGFTLQNGSPSQAFGGFGTSGGGILVVLASPTITNNIITGNHAVCGIGMEVRNGSPLIRGNTITNNTQAGGTGGCGGGGIEVTGDSSHPVAAPLITGNTITNNSLNGGGFGGGISVSASSPTIQNNGISGNSVWNSGGGLNLESGGAPVVVDNIISNNTTLGGGSGAGIYVQGPSSSAAVVINNTIVGNSAFDGSSGIYSDVLAPVLIANNIVVAASGQNGIICDSFSSTFPAFSHNDVTLTGTGGVAWSSNCAGFASTNGNISVDPQFVNAAGNDFHLQAGSPAIDSGDNTVPDLPQLDFDGNPRVAIGNPTTASATVDMGVYEFVAPVATLSPASLSFADQLVNTASAAQTVTLSNTGSNSLQIVSIAVTGDFTQSNACPATLNPGSSCAIQVTFQPTATGVRSGSITLSSNSAPAAPAVPLSGNGVQPAISVSPGAIAFGDQLINTDAPAQTITVSNPGTATLHVNSLSVSGDPDFFTLTNNCVGGTGVAPGGTCSIQVEFAPKSVGAGSATFSIGSDAPTSPTNIALSGNGINPIGSLSTSSLSFGNQLVGTSSAAQTITLSNAGTSPLQINSISISGDFSQSNACPASLNPGSSCTIQVSFDPTATGTRSGSLAISSNSAQPIPTVSLTGTGVDYSVSASPASLSIRSGHQGQTSIVVSAVGGSVSNSVALSCSNLPRGASCSFSPSSVIPGATSASSRLTINTQQSGGIRTPVGTYSITVLGSSAGVVHSTAVTITVTN